MKLLAVRVARSIWLVPTYFLNPRGVFTRPIVEAIRTRYNFLKTPLDNSIPPEANSGYKYEHGMFNGKSGPVIIVSLTIHGDGIVVETRSSTNDADAFLEDAINFGSKKFGLPPSSALPIKKIYASEVNVVFDNTPIILNPKLTPFFDQVSSAIGDDVKGKADFLSLQLATDQTRGQLAAFRIDREANTAIGENRYYSFAPTTTDVHIQLLETLEQLAI